MPTKFFLLAGGAPLPPIQIQNLRRARFTIVLDGAAELARKQGWVPDLIIGDFDSCRPATRKFLEKKGAKILVTPDQNFTDLEKAIHYCILQNAVSIWIGAGVGKRLDHTLANLSFLKKFHQQKGEIILYTPTERVRFLQDEKINSTGKTGRGFALIPFAKCTADSRGLAYELKNTKLELGIHESVSNRALGRRVEIVIKGAALLIEELT